MRPATSDQRRTGFTLIEIMISVAIVVALGAVGMTNLVRFKNRQSLDGVTIEIVSSLRQAHSSAVAQQYGSAWGVYFENPGSGNNDFYSIFQGNSYATGTVIFKKRIGSGLDFIDPAASSSKQVLFNKATGLPSASSSIRIRVNALPNVSTTITVNRQGAVSY